MSIGPGVVVVDPLGQQLECGLGRVVGFQAQGGGNVEPRLPHAASAGCVVHGQRGRDRGQLPGGNETCEIVRRLLDVKALERQAGYRRNQWTPLDGIISVLVAQGAQHKTLDGEPVQISSPSFRHGVGPPPIGASCDGRTPQRLGHRRSDPLRCRHRAMNVPARAHLSHGRLCTNGPRVQDRIANIRSDGPRHNGSTRLDGSPSHCSETSRSACRVRDTPMTFGATVRDRHEMTAENRQ